MMMANIGIFLFETSWSSLYPLTTFCLLLTIQPWQHLDALNPWLHNYLWNCLLRILLLQQLSNNGTLVGKVINHILKLITFARMTGWWKERNTFQTKIKVYAVIVLSGPVYGNDTYHHHIQLRDKFYQHLLVPGFTPDGRAQFPTMRSQDSCNPEKSKPFYMKVNSPGQEGSWARGRQMKPYEGPL